MPRTIAVTDGLVKFPSNRSRESSPQIGETNFRVINKIMGMCENPAAVFGRLIGRDDKTAKRKLQFARVLSVEDLGRLIREERGFDVLEAVMGDAKPEWWRIIVPLKKQSDIKKMQRAASRLTVKAIEDALDADTNLTAALHYAETLSDQDHARPYIDALRSVGRIQNRTMAPSKRTK